MRNFIQPGRTLTLIAPTGGVVAGTPVKIGAFFVVPVATAAEGEEFAGEREGVFELSKTSAQAWSAGDRVYWNAGTSKVSNVATDGQMVGIATEDAANPSSTGLVCLTPGAEMLEGPQAAVADVATADADATYGAPEQNLINELKTQVNALLARLRLAGIIAP